MIDFVCLQTADRMLTSVIRGTRGTWPRACAWLLRHELEAAMDRFWERVQPEIGRARTQRPKLLLLSHYAGPEVGQRAGYLWSVLSRAGHHHWYELGVTAGELARYHSELLEIIALLDAVGRPQHLGTATR
ncbi:hypothetical protein OHA21_27060 [Actinoplanes sp. NBC_00393]|uniref:hypothetical protein n=1 Tax=Actinoplanes sp. NBC_00393 TaxID=2975953 RepID=UPI002E235C3B